MNFPFRAPFIFRGDQFGLGHVSGGFFLPTCCDCFTPSDSRFLLAKKIACLTKVVWVVVSTMLYFHSYLGKIPILAHIFQMGWNHQLEKVGRSFPYFQFRRLVEYDVLYVLDLPLFPGCQPPQGADPNQKGKGVNPFHGTSPRPLKSREP